jgi:hypothetical protein
LIQIKPLTSEEEFEFWEETEIRGSQILGNRVDVPTIHSAGPLIFPLPNYFVGGLLQLTGVLSCDVYLLDPSGYSSAAGNRYFETLLTLL